MWLWSPESHLVSTGKSNSTAHVAVTHTEVVFSSFLCLPTFTLPIFFWYKVFPLRAAVMCRNDKHADDSETARRKQKLQAWGYRKCHPSFSLVWVTNCTLFLMLPPTFDKILKHCTKLAEWTHGMFVYLFFKWAILKFEPFSKPFLSVAQSRHLTLLRQGRFLISQQWKLAADSH